MDENEVQELEKLKLDLERLKVETYAMHRQLRRLVVLQVAQGIAANRFIPESVLKIADQLEVWVKKNESDQKEVPKDA